MINNEKVVNNNENILTQRKRCDILMITTKTLLNKTKTEYLGASVNGTNIKSTHGNAIRQGESRPKRHPFKNSKKLTKIL